jgi:hypothetical protein
MVSNLADTDELAAWRTSLNHHHEVAIRAVRGDGKAVSYRIVTVLFNDGRDIHLHGGLRASVATGMVFDPTLRTSYIVPATPEIREHCRLAMELLTFIPTTSSVDFLPTESLRAVVEALKASSAAREA